MVSGQGWGYSRGYYKDREGTVQSLQPKGLSWGLDNFNTLCWGVSELVLVVLKP